MSNRPVLIILMLALLLLSGCFKMGVDQTLNRDGTVDITLTFNTESALMRDIIDRRLVLHDSIADSTIIEVQNMTVKYIIDDVQLSDGALFVLDNQSQSIPFLDKDKFIIEKRSRFPFVYYYVEVDLEHDLNMDNTSVFGAMLAGGVFNLDYALSVFGKVVDTDGEQIDDRTVKFMMRVGSNKVLHVTFREFFWSSWFE